METKQSKSSQVVLIAVIALIGLGTMFVNASDKWWNPPGPPGPTMKSLDEVEARTPIKASDLPLTIDQSGSYYLVETINFATENTTGITITASNVTVDLNGYALIGPGMGGSGHGITSGSHRITVLNGSVCSWRGSGISIVGRCNQVRHVKAVGNGGRGILTGNGSIISDCVASSNGSDGIYAEPECVIRNCVSRYNDGHGFQVYGRSVLSNCTACKNHSDGIQASDDNVIRGCTASDNDSYGIDAGSRCIITECVSNSNGGAGIYASASLVTANTCVGNNPNLNLSSCTTSNNHVGP